MIKFTSVDLQGQDVQSRSKNMMKIIKDADRHIFTRIKLVRQFRYDLSLCRCIEIVMQECGRSFSTVRRIYDRYKDEKCL